MTISYQEWNNASTEQRQKWLDNNMLVSDWPTWTQEQIDQNYALADEMLTKMSHLPESNQ